MTATATTPNPANRILKFETRPCSRCGGTGHYSFNQVNGSVCFGCRGAKNVLTANGRRARDAYDKIIGERMSVDAAELEPGMRVRAHAHSPETIWGGEHRQAWYTVGTVTVDDGWVQVTFADTDRSWTYYRDGGPRSRARIARPGDTELRNEIFDRIDARFKGAWIEDAPAAETPAPAAPVLSGSDKTPAAPAAPEDTTRYTLRTGTYGAAGTVWDKTVIVTGEAALRAALTADDVPTDPATLGLGWARRGSGVMGTVWHWNPDTPTTDAEVLSAAYLASRSLAHIRDEMRDLLATLTAPGADADPARVDAVRALYRDLRRKAWAAIENCSGLRERWLDGGAHDVPWRTPAMCLR